MTEPEELQIVNRTFVRCGGQTLSFFSGCDYFRLSSYPAVVNAVGNGLKQFGLSVSASRTTTGNHEIYQKLEAQLAKFFSTESALLVSSGYAAGQIAAQALAGNFSHAFIDERAHPALQDAALWLNCPTIHFKHRNPEHLQSLLHRFGPASRPIVLTEGMFAHDGTLAPLRQYLKMLPRTGCLLIDDAHGAGVVGRSGGGAVESEGVTRKRVVQCITLSKAFGTYGGAVLGSRGLRNSILQRSRMFIGSTPIPPPLANAALISL
jgi:7-keto-8-aminopelargonate synthetase-like enzyme